MARVDRPEMIGMQLIGVCPKCHEKFQVTLDAESIVFLGESSWRTLYRCYEEHYDAVHADSWQKLAGDAVRSLRRVGRDVVVFDALESRLTRLEAKQ